MSRRPRSTEKILHELFDWMGNYPVLMRLESRDKTPEEAAEIASYAAAVARCNSRLLRQWQRKQCEKKELQV